jgi:hypothetical protein
MPTIAELNALTQEMYLPRIVTTFGSEIPVLKVLRAKGPQLQGGSKIRKSIAYQYTKGGSFGRGQKFDLSGEENFTASEWTWRYYYWPTLITIQDERENSGPTQVHDMMEAKAEVMRFGGMQQLANHLETGTGADGSLDINSLDHAMDDESGTLTTLSHGAANTIYGGIDKATYTWWAGKVKGLGGAGHGPTYNNIKSIITLAHDSDIMPNLGTAYSSVIDTYMMTQQPQQQYIADGSIKTLMAGFKGAGVDGIPLIADNHTPYNLSTHTANRIRFYNTNYMGFITHVDDNFRLDGWKEPIDQGAKANKLFWTGNIILWDPRRFATGYDFDADDLTD